MRTRLAEVIVARKLAITLGTVAFYLLVLLPVTIALFPDSTLWLSLLVLFIGFLDELKDLAGELAEWLTHQEEANHVGPR